MMVGLRVQGAIGMQGLASGLFVGFKSEMPYSVGFQTLRLGVLGFGFPGLGWGLAALRLGF